MSDKPQDNAELDTTLTRLSEAIERLNGLVEMLSVELAQPISEGAAFDGAEGDDDIDLLSATPPRTLH